jgi:prepilin-type N-terminal cleavage/methylation domain-containing protein
MNPTTKIKPKGNTYSIFDPAPAQKHISVLHAFKTRAFTLLEVLIAIALLAAIAALLITNLDKILGGGNKEIARIFVNETLETPPAGRPPFIMA